MLFILYIRTNVLQINLVISNFSFAFFPPPMVSGNNREWSMLIIIFPHIFSNKFNFLILFHCFKRFLKLDSFKFIPSNVEKLQKLLISASRINNC